MRKCKKGLSLGLVICLMSIGTIAGAETERRGVRCAEIAVVILSGILANPKTDVSKKTENIELARVYAYRLLSDLDDTEEVAPGEILAPGGEKQGGL